MQSPLASLGRYRARRAAERQVRTDRRAALDAPVYAAGVIRTGLVRDSTQPNASMLLRELNGWSAIAARAIAERLMCLELEVVQTRADGTGTEIEEVLDDHPLNDVFDANPVFDSVHLLALLGYWLAQCGDAYLLKVGNRLGQTSELWPLPPDRMEIVSDPGLVVGGYVYHSPRGQVRYEADDVIRIWRPDPANIFGGLGGIGPQAIVHDASKFIDQTMRSHYEKDAIPKVAMLAEATAAVPMGDVLTRFVKDWRRRYNRRTGDLAGVPTFMPPGFKPFEFTAFGGAVENVEMMNAYRDRILMSYGVPRSILGDVVDVNRAAAETNQFVFDTHTIVPLTKLVACTLTRRLARDFGADISVRFKKFVVDDKAGELLQEEQDLLQKVRSVNQVREDRGLDPVPWGEEPIGTFGDVPYRPDEAAANVALPPDNPAALGIDQATPPEGASQNGGTQVHTGGSERPLEALRAGRRNWWTPAAAWLRFVQTEQRYRPEFERAMRAVFAAQRDALLEQLPKLLAQPRTRLERATSIDDFFDPTSWSALFRRLVEPVRRRAFREIGIAVVEKTGTTANFRLTEDAERVLLRQGASLMARVNETTRRNVRATLIEGVHEGEGQDGIAARIRDVFRTRRDHARTIARTEVLRASSGAHLEGFRQSGGVVSGKRWNTSEDDAVRDSHESADGQEVGDIEAFTLGDGEQADAPGIGAGGGELSAGNSINCRCFVTPVFLSEA